MPQYLPGQFRAFADRSAIRLTPDFEAPKEGSIDRVQALEDLLQAHAELIQLECAFTEVLIQAAIGMVPVEELDQKARSWKR